MNKKGGILRIGTSGIVVPGSKQTFPEAYKSTSRLTYYSSLFNTLEINSSFHKVPSPNTFERWAQEVPNDFTFTVKVWREITHVKKLTYSQEKIDFFMEAANKIGDKKGCLLIQFPASISLDYLEVVQSIIYRFKELNVNSLWKICLEVRHISWYGPSTYEWLKKSKVSLVFHDIEASRTPENYDATEVQYFRFHGPIGNYRGSYSPEFLNNYAIKIRERINGGEDVYVYFNNTMGEAFNNAQLLKQLVNI